jgi:hypothetical protein
MANTRLSMRRIKEDLRLQYEQQRSRRLIAQPVGASPTTVGDYIVRAESDVEALLDSNRKKPNFRHRIEQSLESAVVAFAQEQPAFGQASVFSDL